MIYDFGDLTIHGFFLGNIQKAVIKDILESGDPEGYLWALSMVFEQLTNYVDDHESTWVGDFERHIGWGEDA